jgi:iron complex transport system substrate-binding protein
VHSCERRRPGHRRAVREYPSRVGSRTDPVRRLWRGVPPGWGAVRSSPSPPDATDDVRSPSLPESAIHTLTRLSTIPLLATSPLLLAGCATATQPVADPTPTIDPAAPVVVDNCGFEVVFDSAPERVVTIKSSTTESLLALGLGDRIVGTAFQDGPVPSQWTADAANLTLIAEKVPSEEVVLTLEPDLIFAGWESNFSADGAGERGELAALGVASYASPAACQSSGQPNPLTFENVFADLEQPAAIFRSDATELITEQRAELRTITPVGDGRTALWFSSGSDTPYVGAGIGAPQLVLDTVGLKNIAGDLPSSASHSCSRLASRSALLPFCYSGPRCFCRLLPLWDHRSRSA